MRDDECIGFLQWALPQLRLRWPGFRKVRGQVCKRIGRRLRELDIPCLAAYRDYLAADAGEWALLDGLCRVTISRFWRDAGVFECLRREVLPELARRAHERGEARLRVCSLGCASGEEAYSIALLWRFELQARFPGLELRLLALDSDPAMAARLAAACYPASSLKDLPAGWRDLAFEPAADGFRLKPEYRDGVEFVHADLRERIPDGPFDLLLCRNLAFTYFDQALQREVLERLRRALRPGGALLLGIHENLPADAGGFEDWSDKSRIYRRLEAPSRPRA